MRAFPIAFCCVVLLGGGLAQSDRPPEIVFVPAPDPVTAVYRGHGISFKYPQNWQLNEQGGRIVAAPPGARRIAPDGQEHFSHGIFVGFFQPSERLSVNQAVDQLIGAFRQGNAAFREVGQRRSTTSGTATALSAGWTSNDPYLGEEGGLLFVLQEAHGFWWWLLISPAADLVTYMPVFVGVTGSIDFEQEDKSQADEHSEHWALVNRVVERLKRNQFRLPNFQVMIGSSQEINAYANQRTDTVILPESMVHFLHQDEGELAFVVAHELGHLQDKQCSQLAPQVRITREGQSRFCEARADEIGLQYLVGAGYNPFDAAAFFGRLLMFSGRTSVFDILWGRIANDHPVDVDRIENLRQTVSRYCQQNPAACPTLGHGSATESAQETKVIRDPAEYNLYVTAVQQQSPYAKAVAIDDFLRRYPDSVVAGDALRILRAACQGLGNIPQCRR